jgi:aminobenzoyl-glutamate utilization protein A
MSEKILAYAYSMKEEMIGMRRDFHKYAEVGWTEFRTASIVAQTLTTLGYDVLVGGEVIAVDAMMGVPTVAELEKHAERAIEQGAHPGWVGKMHGGKTGVVGILKFQRPGPTVALRFDLDANDATEAEDVAHYPYAEKFASVNKGAMHACGHDGHIAVGLALAKMFAELKGELSGRIKFIFQPAEEGVRGAKAMVAKGIVDDVDYLLGMHFGFKMQKTGQLACNVNGFLATTKLDAEFSGTPAHAGAAPETGRNALLAAATAATYLHAISRHGQGASRINVGILQAGTGRNVVPANALIKLETRGATSEINEYMYQEAIRIIESAAKMHGVNVKISEEGGAAGGSNSPQLVITTEEIARALGVFTEIVADCNFNASEDCSYFMERVQQRGGQAAYVMVGANLAAGHHDFHFDFDEEALVLGVALIGSVAQKILQSQ